MESVLTARALKAIAFRADAVKIGILASASFK